MPEMNERIRYVAILTAVITHTAASQAAMPLRHGGTQCIVVSDFLELVEIQILYFHDTAAMR